MYFPTNEALFFFSFQIQRSFGASLCTNPDYKSEFRLMSTQQAQNINFVYHLYNVGPTLGRRFLNVIQKFCVCWESSRAFNTKSLPRHKGGGGGWLG